MCKEFDLIGDTVVNYREYRDGDLIQFIPVYVQAFTSLYGEKAQKFAKDFMKLFQAALLEGIEGGLFVAEINDKIVGFTAIHEQSRGEYQLSPMVVLPSFQRQGIGSQLLNLCIKFVHSRQAKQFYLKVHDSNQCAINLYKKYGLVVTEKFPSNLEGVDYLKMVYIL